VTDVEDLVAHVHAEHVFSRLDEHDGAHAHEGAIDLADDRKDVHGGAFRLSLRKPELLREEASAVTGDRDVERIRRARRQARERRLALGVRPDHPP
jgi:hypothetical protein